VFPLPPDAPLLDAGHSPHRVLAVHQGESTVPSIGPMEIIVLLVIALIVFGPKRLPELGKSLGGGMREFKQSITGRHDRLAAETEDTKIES